MAEFALGLTKMAVEGTVSRVKLAIDEETKLKVKVQNDLMFITGEFEMMQSFLNVANKERAKNEVVRTWVRQIRDLAFDVEDCVELVVSLDIKSGWSWLWRVVPSCMAPPRPLDQAVAEIQLLKARVGDVSQRNTRYNLITDSPGSDSSKHDAALVSKLPASELMLDAGASSSSAFQVLSEVWEAAGKKRTDMGDLKKLLAMEAGLDLEVISLWPSSGGSAAAAAPLAIREAYNDPEIRQEFSVRAWVKLTKHQPFNLDEFLNTLLAQLDATSYSHHEPRSTEECGPHPVKARLMQQQRYLIIVEQLSTVVEWDAIIKYLPDTKNGSRVVVTTEQLGLALSCTGKPYQVSELTQFSHGQSLCAFFNKNKGYSDQGGHVFSSTRMVEACDWITEFELIGHHSEWSLLCGNLQDIPLVISVWGIAGVGKSALVRTIYYTIMMSFEHTHLKTIHPALGCLEQVQKYGWVDAPHPFSLINLARRLLLDFHSDDLEAKETEAAGMMEGLDPIQRCRKFMHEEKCFVVIDGLRSTDDWDLIKAAFLSDRIKGCILVITNEEAVATHCVHQEKQVVNVKGLEAEAALDLFTKIAQGTEQLTSDMVELSGLITTKCGGLPKVIAAIGEYCRRTILVWSFLGIDSKRLLKSTLKGINADFMGTLETDPEFDSLRGLFSWMRTYFDDCPDSLKPCIFYLSVFPLGHNIRRKRLLRRWIAEGYSRDTPGSTTEENGEMFFSQLVKLSIIQQQRQEEESERKADMCQVNGFFREYIISRPMQDNLVFALEGHCILNSQRAGQHLAVSSGWYRDQIVFESMDFTRLRSLTVFGEWRSFFISGNVNMKLLRVLDLEDTTSGVTDGDLEQIGVLLPRLKFLSLRGCKDITRLPGSLGSLRQLQTLDIKGTSIVMLPPGIMKLEKLQYIRAGTTHLKSTSSEDDNAVVAGVARPPQAEGDGASTSQPPAAASTMACDGASTNQQQLSSRPRGHLVFSLLSKLRSRFVSRSAHDAGVQFPAAARGTWKLTALHTLGVINVAGAGGKLVLREMENIAQLRKLKLSGINRKNWRDFCFAISGQGYLESLSVRLHDEQQQDFCFSDISKPPAETLKSLKVYGGSAHVSPLWMKQLRNLSKAHVEDLELTISTQEDIDCLMELPCKDMFRHLRVKPIRDCELHYGRRENIWYGAGFKAATVLKIDCGSYELKIVFGKLIPEYVEVLVVHCSYTTTADQSSLELSGLKKLPKLKEVWLKGSYSEAVRQHLQQKVDGRPSWMTRAELKLDDRQTTHQSPDQ